MRLSSALLLFVALSAPWRLGASWTPSVNTVPVARTVQYNVDGNGIPTQALALTGNYTGLSYIDAQTFAYDYDNWLLMNARRKMTGGIGNVWTWYRYDYAYDYRTRRVGAQRGQVAHFALSENKISADCAIAATKARDRPRANF